MMTVEEIRAALVDRRLSIIAEKTGLHPNTIANIRDGKVVPAYPTLEALSSYLRQPA